MKQFYRIAVWFTYVTSACILPIPVTAFETITNFDTDTIGAAPGEPVTFTTGNVTVQTASDFTGDLPLVFQDSPFTYLTTGPGITGAGSSGVDRTGEGFDEHDIAEMYINYNTTGEKHLVRFNWSVISSEGDIDMLGDPFQFSMDGIVKERYQVGNNPYTDTIGLSFTGGVVSTITGPDGSVFDDGAFGPGSLNFYNFGTGAGSHTLGIFLGDEVDGRFDTGLLIDNIEVLDFGARQSIVDFESDVIGQVPEGPVTSIVGNVTVEDPSGFTGGNLSGIDSQFAYLTTGPGSTGVGSSGVDRTGDGDAESDVAIMSIEFVVEDDNSLLEWSGGYLTSEDNSLYTSADPIQISIDGVIVDSYSVGYINGPFAQTAALNFSGGTPITGPDGSFFDDGFIRGGGGTLLDAGIHTIEFFIGDEFDDTIDTALLVDNIWLTAPELPPIIPVPNSPGLWLFAVGLLGLVGNIRWKKRLNHFGVR